MPSFLTNNQIYDIINRELPEGLFAYSPAPATFYITTELDSYAFCIAKTYTTMQTIYNNEFIISADEKISDYEIMYFGAISLGLSLAERRARIIAKIRSQAFVSLWDILTFICTYVPTGTYVQIVENASYDGSSGWCLGVSKLNFNTFLGSASPQSLYGKDADLVWTGSWVFGDPIPAGVFCDPLITQASVLAIREMAYSYVIRIFGYEITGELLTSFEKDLNRIHPTRSKYYLFQNLILADYSLTVSVDDVGQFSKINCIATDLTQMTGYKGKTYL